MPTLNRQIDFVRTGIRAAIETGDPAFACMGNNLIEQDHRGVKARIGPMLGFKRFRTAAVTIAGIELLRRIRKGQFNLRRLRLNGRGAPAIWNAVLAA